LPPAAQWLIDSEGQKTQPAKRPVFLIFKKFIRGMTGAITLTMTGLLSNTLFEVFNYQIEGREV